MNDMIIKSVDLMGDTVMAVKDNGGKIYAGVSYLCNALGMSRVQKDTQVDKIREDKTLSKGYRKFPVGVFDQNNEAVGIRLDFIPIWLAKITITKRMEKDHPELADKLLEYQLKAKDILAEAFLPKQEVPNTIPGQIQLLAQGYTDIKADVDGIKADLEALKNDMPVFTADAKNIQDALKKKAVGALGGYGSNAYRDNSTRGYVFADIQKELRRQFGVKRYDEIKHKDTPVALEIISQYKLPLALKNRVSTINAQQSLNL